MVKPKEATGPRLCSGKLPEVTQRNWQEEAAEWRDEAVRANAALAIALTSRDMFRSQLEKAIQLLHMLDRTEARHPDVAVFLNEFSEFIEA